MSQPTDPPTPNQRKLPTKKIVIFIDDKRAEVADYIRELEIEDYSPVFIRQVDDIETKLSELGRNNPLFFVVDMMMPPGKRYGNSATEKGLFTGAFVVRDLRKDYPVTPIILWTRSDSKQVRRTAERKGEITLHCYYALKDKYNPEMLVDLVKRYERTGRFPSRHLRKLIAVVRRGISIFGIFAKIRDATKGTA